MSGDLWGMVQEETSGPSRSEKQWQQSLSDDLQAFEGTNGFSQACQYCESRHAKRSGTSHEGVIQGVGKFVLESPRDGEARRCVLHATL